MKHINYILISVISLFFIHCGKEEQTTNAKDYSFEVKETFDKEMYQRGSKRPGLKLYEDFHFSFEIESKEEGIEYEIYYNREAQLFAPDGSIIQKSKYYPLKGKTIAFRYKPKYADSHGILVRIRNKNHKEGNKEFDYNIYYYQNRFFIQNYPTSKKESTDPNDQKIIYQGQEIEDIFKILTQNPQEDFLIKFEKLEPYHEKSVVYLDNKAVPLGEWTKIANIDKFRIKYMSWVSGGVNLKFVVKNPTAEDSREISNFFQRRYVRLSDDFNFSKKITQRIGEELPITGRVQKVEKLSNKVWATTTVMPNTRGLETFTKKEVTLTEAGDFVLNVPTHKAGIYNYTIVVEDEFGNKTERTFENIKVQQNDFTISLRPKQTQTYVGGYLPIEYNLATLDNDNPNQTDFSFTFDDRGNGGYIVFQKNEQSTKYRAGQRIPIRPNVADFYYVSPQNRGNKTISFVFQSGQNTKPAIEVRQEFIGELFSAEIQNNHQRMKVNHYYPITLSLRAINGVHQPNITYSTALNKKARYKGRDYQIGEKIALEFPNTTLEILEEDPYHNIARREQTPIEARVENTSGMQQLVQKNILLFRPFSIAGFDYSVKVSECSRNSEFSGAYDYDNYNSGTSQKEEVRLFLTANDVQKSDDMNTLSGVLLEFEFKNERDYTGVSMYPIDIQTAIQNNRFGEPIFGDIDTAICKRVSNGGFVLLDKPFIVKARQNGYVIWQGEISSWIDNHTNPNSLEGNQRYYIRIENEKIFIN